ncbi:hypothetical protein [Paenibacillus antarcticus]|uniref:Uncharacterized protein n=1 Tax=Paenibacillus antarcticus TaxID=253703 RepID=A0A162M8X9_9BACL|nr:hypothetical protein [Paenibacillus antarcticus]OAB40263.1 hypothetical protein PBAT_23435 [Paenibacillus antarcticus]
MPYSILYIIIISIALIGGIGTFMIGYSKENRKKNPEYDRRIKRNLGKLSLFYIVALVVGVGGLAIYLSGRI